MQKFKNLRSSMWWRTKIELLQLWLKWRIFSHGNSHCFHCYTITTPPNYKSCLNITYALKRAIWKICKGKQPPNLMRSYRHPQMKIHCMRKILSSSKRTSWRRKYAEFMFIGLFYIRHISQIQCVPFGFPISHEKKFIELSWGIHGGDGN